MKMKAPLLLCVAAFCLTLSVLADDKEIEYPESNPVITVTIPDGWLTHQQDGVLQAAASQNLDTMLVVKPLNATKKEGSQAVAEIKEALDKAYGESIEYDKLEEGGASNLGLYVLNATAKTPSQNEGDVTAFINSIIVSFPDSEELLLVQFLSTAEGSEKNGEAISEVIRSIKKVE